MTDRFMYCEGVPYADFLFAMRHELDVEAEALEFSREESDGPGKKVADELRKALEWIDLAEVSGSYQIEREAIARRIGPAIARASSLAEASGQASDVAETAIHSEIESYHADLRNAWSLLRSADLECRARARASFDYLGAWEMHPSEFAPILASMERAKGMKGGHNKLDVPWAGHHDELCDLRRLCAGGVDLVTASHEAAARHGSTARSPQGRAKTLRRFYRAKMLLRVKQID